MTKKLSKITYLAILVFAVIAQANTVELDLFTLGCQTTYDINSPYWETNFNLGVTFSEISNVYINWSGEITGGLAVNYSTPDEPYPIDVGITTWIPVDGWPQVISIYGGQDSYPDPEPFNNQSEFVLHFGRTWHELLDGTGTIGIGYTELGSTDNPDWYYVEGGNISLNSAKIIIEGATIPEPLTITFFTMGIVLLRKK